MNYTCLIVEDEHLARKTIKSFLRKYSPSIEVIGEVESIRDSLDFLEKNSVDILFVDIQLKDGNSMTMLNQIDTDRHKLIFTTAFEHYALEAFRMKAFGYLLKPIDPIDFKEILNRVIKDLKFKEVGQRKNVKIITAKGSIWVDQLDIIRCESDNNYTKIFVRNTPSPYTLSKALKRVQMELLDQDLFLRCHRSHLINLRYLDKKEICDGHLHLSDGSSVPVSKANKNKVYSLLEMR